MPARVGDKKRRGEKIRAAKAELEAEARAAAAAERKRGRRNEKPKAARNPEDPPPPQKPPTRKRKQNFTDPESRIVKTKGVFVQGYNAQPAVDAEAQVIAAYGLDANSSDPASTDADGRRGRSQYGPQAR